MNRVLFSKNKVKYISFNYVSTISEYSTDKRLIFYNQMLVTYFRPDVTYYLPTYLLIHCTKKC